MESRRVFLHGSYARDFFEGALHQSSEAMLRRVGGCNHLKHMGVSLNGGTPKSSILIGFSIIFTIHFGVPQF